MDLELHHYSKTPFTGPVKARQQDPGPYWFKPNGLWVSADTFRGKPQHGWPRWGLSENYGTFDARSRVILAPGANVLRVQSSTELVLFDQRFSEQYGRVPTLNWARVAQEYAGVIICPYQWGLRMELHWYYSWDCASGCIWDPAAIDRIEPDLDYPGPSIFKEEDLDA